jgi:lipopolysaccharide transport system ATP-binding protein
MGRPEIRAKFDQIVEFSGVEQFLDTPVKRYSSGMRVRLGFAVAAYLDPQILIVDEVLAVGDMEFQNRCLGKMSEVAQGGRTVLFVSHNMGAIQTLCNRGIVLRKGKLVFDGQVDRAVREYLGYMESTSGLSDDNPHRRGSHRVKMQQVQLIDRNQQPINRPVAGEPMGVRVSYRNLQNLRQAHVNITFYDDQGVAVMNAGTAYLRMPLELRESGEITCWIQRLPLIPGRYRMSVGLHDREEVYDAVSNALFLDVPSSVYYPTGAVPDRKQTSVMIDHSWEHSP